MRTSKKKVIISTCITTAATAAFVSIAAASNYITKKLAAIAMDRILPSIHCNKTASVSGEAQDSDIQQLRVEAAQHLREKVHEVIELHAHDGERLVGHWFCQPNAKRTILAMHGWRSSWADDFGLIADFLLSNGCNILFSEQRGQNSSGGTYMGFGLLERYDCVDWAAWIQSKCTLPIYLSGVSMGASTVLMASSLNLPENVHGIMADCGFTSPHAIWEYVASNNFHLSYNSFRRKTIDELCKLRFCGESPYFSCEDALRNCKVPVLFFHGSEDHFVPVEMTYQNYKACASEKRLMIVPGAGHAKSYWVEPEKYEKQLMQFWADFD